MRQSLGLAAAVVAMGMLGAYMAYTAQDHVWLLVPGLGILLAIYGLTRALRD